MKKLLFCFVLETGLSCSVSLSLTYYVAEDGYEIPVLLSLSVWYWGPRHLVYAMLGLEPMALCTLDSTKSPKPYPQHKRFVYLFIVTWPHPTPAQLRGCSFLFGRKWELTLLGFLLLKMALKPSLSL